MPDSHQPSDEREVGFTVGGVLDEGGKVSLPVPIREVKWVGPGSSVAHTVIDQPLLLFPVDAELARLMDDAATVLAEAGLTAQDILDELPSVRAEVLVEMYGAEFMEELERQHAALHAAAQDE